MPTILKGRRASQYFGLAKNLLDGLKRLGLKFVSRVLEVPGGRIIAQDNSAGGLIHIDVRNPYLAVYVRDAGYTLHAGGLTGETFLPDLPFVTSDTQTGNRLASGGMLGAGHGVALGMLTFGGIGGGETIGTAPYQTTQIYAIGTRFTAISYLRNIHTSIPGDYAVACTLDGLPFLQYEPLGAPNATDVCTAAHAIVAVAVGEELSIIFKFTNPETLDYPVEIWPPVSLNGGRPDLETIVSPITCIGRGKLMFIDMYKEDWRTVEDPKRLSYQLVTLSDFGASYTSVNLTTVDPSLPAYWTANNDDVPTLVQPTDIAYLGGTTLVMLLSLSTERRLYRSTNNGASWAALTWPGGPDELANYYGMSHHHLVSLYAGHVEFTTTEGTVFRRYVSTDSGSTWAMSMPAAGELRFRLRANTVVMNYDENGTPTSYAAAASEADGVKVRVYEGMSFSDISMKLLVTTNFDYSEIPGRNNHAPMLAWIGSEEFNPPLLPGYPGVLEYPA